MASPFITVQFKEIDGLSRYLGRIINWVNIEMPKLTFDQADDGAEYMSRLMPSQTGAMIQAVSVQSRRGKGYAIVSRTPSGTSWDGRRNVPYHLYYNLGIRGGYKGSRKSGSYRFFEKTSGYLLSKYPELISRELDKQLNK